jgi:tetratricopeptide (TPR) repeat protein
MAYVQLSYTLGTLGRANGAKADSAMTSAFQLRSRLPERERYNVEGAYYMTAGHDRAKAIPALRRAVELDSSNYDAANSLAVLLSDSRDMAAAEGLYRLALVGEPGNNTILSNMAGMYTEMGRHAAFDSVVGAIERSGAPFPTAPLRYTELWNRRDYDGAERIARAMVDTAPPRRKLGGMDGLTNVAVLRGRLREAERLYAQANDAKVRVRGDTINPVDVAYFQSMVDGEIRGDVARGIAALDAAARAAPVGSLPLARDRSPWLAWGYARLGAAEKAREVVRRYEALLDDGGRRRDYVMLSRLRGSIALISNQPDSAIAWFRRSDVEPDGLPTPNCAPCTALLLGIGFDQAGRADSARKYLTDFVETFDGDRMFVDRFDLAKTLFRLGELYENANDARAATEYYGRFVDLWANADPELQPRVAEARRRIDRINRPKQ